MKKTIEERFEEFHTENPVVYQLFKGYVIMLHRAGKRRYSAKAIMERIRWEQAISTTRTGAWHVVAGKEVKINDHYTRSYVRMFVRDFPAFIDGFETREIKTP